VWLDERRKVRGLQVQKKTRHTTRQQEKGRAGSTCEGSILVSSGAAQSASMWHDTMKR
jgi:hypothetical protein